MAVSSAFTNQLPGLDKIGGGVDTKTAAFASWSSINSLLKLPTDPAQWDDVTIGGSTYKIPKGFRASDAGQSVSTDTVGSGRDDYMKNVAASLSASGSYGGFSGTLSSSFNMTENTTQAYSFGTHTFEYQAYSLTLPIDLTGLLDPKFQADLQNDNVAPADLYRDYGTHYTSSILMGGKASLSLYTQFQSSYSVETITTDVTAAYKSIAASFQTSGSFKYESSQSHETYNSTSSLVLVGGDPTVSSFDAWKATVVSAPKFINFNTQASSNGLVPLYELLDANGPHAERRAQLKAALGDYLRPPLHLRIFCAASPLTEYPFVNVQVEPKYKVLSGGARAAWAGFGELLTASYPISNNQWAAKAKDAFEADRAVLTVYALAVYDPYDWLDIQLVSATSALAQHPTAQAAVGAGYTLTGGGAQVNFEGAGNYLTASYPSNDSTWSVASKDHLVSSPATITAYAIGVKWAAGRSASSALANQITSSTSDPLPHPQASVGAPSATVLVGGGARDTGGGAGNMLDASYPSNGTTWQASGKDQKDSSPGTITAYAVGMTGLKA